MPKGRAEFRLVNSGNITNPDAMWVVPANVRDAVGSPCHDRYTIGPTRDAILAAAILLIWNFELNLEKPLQWVNTANSTPIQFSR